MKSYIAILLLFVSSIALAADEVRKVGESDEVPKDGFADYAELQKWASTSSFGGGKAGKHRIGGKDVYYTDRKFTSGVPTSELMFFTQSHDGRIKMFLLAPMQSKEHSISMEMDMILVSCYNSMEKGFELAMTITPRMLPVSVVKPIVREQGGAGQPATAPESTPEDSDKPQPESEGRSR